MKKYDLVELMINNNSAYDVVENFYNEIFNVDKPPKEIIVVVVSGKKKRDGFYVSFRKIHIYNDIFDASGKINKHSNSYGREIKVYSVKKNKYSLMMYKSIGERGFTFFKMKKSVLDKEVLGKFTRDIVRIAELKLYIH